MSDSAISARRVSKRFGQVSALLDVDLEISGGVVGLLGPNGAGKTTFIRLVTGQIRPSVGEIRVFGQDPWRRPEVLSRVGYCPDRHVMWPELSGRTFLRLAGQLKGLGRKQAAELADELLALVGLEAAAGRPIGTYSQGMRQRIKVAWSLLGDPELVVLDEPLTGCDPVVRSQLIRLVRDQGARGRTVLVSSHILHEVEAMTSQVVVLYQGQVLASGSVSALRSLLDEHPHRIRVRLPEPRRLAEALVSEESVTALTFLEDGLLVETSRPDACYEALARAVVERDLDLEELAGTDEDLEAVFQYLLERRRGWAGRSRKAAGARGGMGA